MSASLAYEGEQSLMSYVPDIIQNREINQRKMLFQSLITIYTILRPDCLSIVQFSVKNSHFSVIALSETSSQEIPIMALFNQAVCLAAGCASTMSNTTDPIPEQKITFPTNVTCGEVNVFYT